MRKLLVILALTLMSASALGMSGHQYPGENLKALCNDKKSGNKMAHPVGNRRDGKEARLTAHKEFETFLHNHGIKAKKDGGGADL